MTPKDKAKELVDKFIEHTMEFDELDGYVEDKDNAKQCALISVDEQIELLLNLSPHMAFPEQVKHLQEIKKEIEKL
jgi:hypothetical protein